MIYRFILKLFICSIGIVIINLITYGILSIYYEEMIGSYVNIVSVFFRDLLFKNKFNLFLSKLGIVSYLIYEFFNDKKEFNEQEAFIVSIRNDLIAIGKENFFYGIYVLIGCGFSLFLFLQIIFSLFIEFPFYRGWKILFYTISIDIPISHLFIFDGIYDEMIFFILSLIYFVAFFSLFFVSFAKKSRFAKNDLKYKYQNKIRLICILYLIYLTPTIFVSIYPVMLYWLNKLFNVPSDIIRIHFSYKVLSYLFVSGFLFTVYKTIKNNIKVIKIGMKEEIKIEIMNEKKNRGS